MKLTKNVLMLVAAGVTTAGISILTAVMPAPVAAAGCNSSKTACSIEVEGSGYCNGHAVGKNCQCNIGGTGWDDGQDCGAPAPPQ